MIGYERRTQCAGCGGRQFDSILGLGIVPLAGYFPTKRELSKQSRYPLNLVVCKYCKLVQTDSVIDPALLFEDYRYLSSVGLSGHFKNVADLINDKYQIKDKKILEIGCNDGVLLEPLKRLGADVEGVDPAKNIVKVARDKGLKVYNDYFNDKTFGGDKFNSKYDIVISNNTFAHIIDIQSVIKRINKVLKSEGIFIFEVHYLKSLIDGKQWDNVYHEHIFYYSITALQKMFQLHNMTLIDFKEIPIHAGSIRVTVRNRLEFLPNKILDRITDESKNICDLNYLNQYGKDVEKHISDFNNQISILSRENAIAGYGASGRANMFCNLTNLNSDIVRFIVDESPERCGRYIANTDIPIVDIETLENSNVNLIIIFAWNYSKMIIEKTQFRKFKYLVAFPTVQLADNYEELRGFESI